MKIAMTGIHVKDPKAAFKFYTEILGFVEHTYMPEANLAIVVSPDDAEGTALLLEPSDNPVAKAYAEGIYQQGLPAIVFSTPDVAAEYARLVALGVRFRGGPETNEWGTKAVFDDTCGNLIQLHQL